MNKIYEFVQRKPLVFTLLLVTLMSISLYWEFIIKDISYLMTIYDGLHQTWPYMSNISDYLRTDGFPMWSFSIGLGSVLGTDWFGNLFYGIPILLGRDIIPSIMIYMQIAKIILAALFFFLFLKKLNLHYYACVLVTVTYSFCGIMITRGAWTKYSTECFIFAFILYSIEIYFRDKKWYLIPISISFAINSFGVYYVYLYTILLFIYATTRYIYSNKFNCKEYLIYILKCGGLFIFGVFMSALFLVPYIFNMFQASRFEQTSDGVNFLSFILNFFKLNSLEVYLSEFYRFYSSDSLGIFYKYSGASDNYLSAPLFYCGLIILLIIPQSFYFANKKLRILLSFAVITALLYLIFPNINLLFNGFMYVSFKFSSLWICIVLLVIAAYTINEIIKRRTINTKLLIITSITLIGLFLSFSITLIDFEINFEKGIAILIVIFLVIYSLILYYYKGIKQKNIALTILFVFIVIEAYIFSSITINSSISWVEDTINNFDNKTRKGCYFDYSIEALNYIKQTDNNFYRISKQYSDIYYCDPLFNNYYGSSYYDTFVNKSYVEFCSKLNIANSNTSNILMLGLKDRTLLETLTAHKYYIADSDYKPPLGYEYYTSSGDKAVYKNKYSLPLGFAYNKYILSRDFDNLDNLAKDMALLDAVVVDEPIYNMDEYNSPFNPKLIELEIDYSGITTNLVEVENNLPEYLKGVDKTIGDPIIIFPIPSDGTQKNYKITFDIISNFKGISQLFWATQTEDFNNENSLVIEYEKGTTPLEFTIENTAVKELRIDPAMALGDYHIKNLKVYEIDNTFLDKNIISEIEINSDEIIFVNVDNVTINSAKSIEFNAINNDPIIAIPIPSNPKVETYDISFDITSDSGEDLAYIFWGAYITDFTEEFSQKQVYSQENKTVEFSIDNVGINYFRIDPGMIEGKYKIENLKIIAKNTSDLYINAVNERLKEPFVIEKFSQNHITGNVDIKGDRMMFFSIPYAKGWSMKVDGIPTEIQKVSIGFIGVPLTEGVHTIELRFITPGLILGAILSGLGLLTYILMIIFRKKLIWLSLGVKLYD